MSVRNPIGRSSSAGSTGSPGAAQPAWDISAGGSGGTAEPVSQNVAASIRAIIVVGSGPADRVRRAVVCDVVLVRLTLRDRQGLPVRAREVLGEEHDLSDVVRVVGQLALDGLQHRVLDPADPRRLEETGLAEGLERREEER